MRKRQIAMKKRVKTIVLTVVVVVGGGVKVFKSGEGGETICNICMRVSLFFFKMR
jgi:hypothetical protein